MRDLTSARRFAHLIGHDGPGGAERIVAALATSLQAAGSRNVVFVPRGGEGWLAEQLHGSGVAIEHFSIDRAFAPSSAASIAEAFRRHRIDVAHSHEFEMAIYGAWAAWKASVPHVITMHGGTYWGERLRRRLALRLACGLSGRTVAVSEELRRAVSRSLRIPLSNIRVVTNGVRYEPPASVTLRRDLSLSADDRLIVAVGNLYPVKGHVHLIDAVATLSGSHPHLHVAIAGRGDRADDLVARARARGIERRVHLLGLRSDVPAVLEAGDVFALPSLSEGLPLALLEAMFAGRPIVASDVGEVSRALNHGAAGILVPPGDSAALAAALRQLLDKPIEAATLGERARCRAVGLYDVSQMAGRYLRIYEALIRQRKRVRHARRVTLTPDWIPRPRGSA